jgi:predicted dehydrogenase
MKRLRTAVIGYGRNGSTMHAGAVERNGDFEMKAVCDVDPPRREQAKARFGCTVYEDYHAMLAAQELDLVVVVTRSDQHAAMVRDCLAAGMNVLVTKPWALDEAQAKGMIEARDRSGKLLLPWLPARWGCDFTRVRDLVRSGAIGRVFLVRRAVSSFGTRSDWQTERRFGGGYLLNWGPHVVEPPILVGGSRVRSAFGRLRQTINPGDVEDMFLAVLTLEDGTIVQVEYAVSAESLPSWVVQGTKGTIAVYGTRLVLRQLDPAKPTDPTRYKTMDASGARVAEEDLAGAIYGDEHEVYREIAAALRGERPYPIRAEEALELTRVLDAVRLSDREDRVVRL